jgi:hypothetical protein
MVVERHFTVGRRMRFGALGSIVYAVTLATGAHNSPAQSTAGTAGIALGSLPDRLPEVGNSPPPASQDIAIQAPSRGVPSALDPIVIQARRDREIKKQITKFVSGSVVTYFDESLERWNQPICPLVVGLPSKPAEFVRARVLQVARDSNAPAGSENCNPNLIVVVTNDPDLLLEKWYKGLRGVFNSCSGLGPVKKFLQSSQPVRAFYNARFTSVGGRGVGALELDGLNLPFPSECLSTGQLGTHLRRGSVQAMTSVIIVVDGRQTTKINMGQLSDYIAMIGLAQIRIKADTSIAPSILRLFEGPDPQPEGLTPWDEALLHSLYTTDQSSVLEVPIIEDRMFKQLAGH